MTKTKIFTFIVLSIFSVNVFSQEITDSLILNKLNLIRKTEGFNDFKKDSSLYNISKNYALYVREYYNNLPFGNLEKQVNKMFKNTSDIYREIFTEEKKYMPEDAKEVYLFTASKNKFYSSEELSNTVIYLLIKNKENKHDLLYSDYTKIGISCIWEETFEYKQVIFCIISFEP